MRNKNLLPNINNSDPIAFPDGRINDNDGSGNGTEVSEKSYGDIQEFFGKLMRLAGLQYNGLPESEVNGYQLIDALKNIANKNDIIKNITLLDGFLFIDTKLTGLSVGEYFICKSFFNLNNETQIMGSNGTSFVFNYLPAERKFKSGDYLLLIKTEASFDLIRQADAMNLNQLVTELLFLKGATEAQEYAGTSTQLATTPYTNQLAFARRVIGLDSSLFLASITRNGLYPKQHFEIVSNLGNSPIRNKGFFSGLDLGGTVIGQNLFVGGDILSAIVMTSADNFSTVRCVLAHTMTDNIYKIRMDLESQASFNNDTRTNSPTFKIINATTFDIAIRESSQSSQNLKVHIEAIKY